MFAFTSIAQYHAQLLEGTISCADTVQYYLERIDRSERLNAFVHIFRDEALQQAKKLDQKRQTGDPLGPLHGVVIGIKDVIVYKDHPVSAASGILKGFHSLFSATAVERLVAAEALIIGSLNCDEFGMGSSNENSVYGRVLNAKDESRVSGGSSGGSAVAVQAGLCMVSLGSDTGGSVRQPADFCGVFGMKPGYGRVSRHGLIAYASSFDQIGIMGNNLEDVAVVLETISGADDFDSTVSNQPVPAFSSLLTHNSTFRYVYFPEALEHPSLDPEIRTALLQRMDELRAAGHAVKPVHFEWLDLLVPAYYILTTAEASSNLARYDGVRYGQRVSPEPAELTEFYRQNRSQGFGAEVKRRIMLGSFVLSAGYYDAYFTRAQRVRQRIKDRLDEIFLEADIILMPVSPVTAFPAGEKLKDPIAMYLADIYTVMANLGGLPAIAVPLYQHSNGMPFGMQALANRFDEVSLLQAAKALVNK